MGSGGRMTLDGDVTNVVSVLAAGDDLHITGDLDNQGVDLLATYDVDTHDKEVIGKKKVFDGDKPVWKYRLATRSQCSFRLFGKCLSWIKIPYYKRYKSSEPSYRYDSVYGWVSKGRTQTTVAMATVSAVAQAQGTVSVDGDIKNGTVTHGASYMARSGVGQGAAPMDRQSLAVMVGALDMASGLSLPTSGLFITQTAPGHRYLIETNSAYIDTQRFIGSSYFLDRMGFSDMTVRLLGDAFLKPDWFAIPLCHWAIDGSCRRTLIPMKRK